MSRRKPDMRRPRAGKCRRPVAEGVVLWQRAAVRHHNRRRMIDVTKMHADRLPGLLVLLDQPLTDDATGGVTFRARRIDFGPLRGADQTAIVLQRNLRGPRRSR